MSAVMLEVQIQSEELKLSVLATARRATLVLVTSSKAWEQINHLLKDTEFAKRTGNVGERQSSEEQGEHDGENLGKQVSQFVGPEMYACLTERSHLQWLRYNPCPGYAAFMAQRLHLAWAGTTRGLDKIKLINGINIYIPLDRKNPTFHGFDLPGR